MKDNEMQGFYILGWADSMSGNPQHFDCPIPADWPLIKEYLMNEENVLISRRIEHKCKFCTELVGLSSITTDGKWLWQVNWLVHVVEKHGYGIHEGFLDRIRRLKYTAPVMDSDELSIELDRLEVFMVNKGNSKVSGIYDV